MAGRIDRTIRGYYRSVQREKGRGSNLEQLMPCRAVHAEMSRLKWIVYR